ncbi:MAG TPA: hypothetical protein VHB68_13030 [Steroidobacteraceae bacterium]|nr:hypothetical protein [Steroidobacteraceae bacterium]
MKALLYVAFAYVLVQLTRYVLGARLYLTCALQEVKSRQVGRQQLDPGELRVLSVFDAELAAAGFTHLGFAEVTPLLTHYSGPLVNSVFANERIPAYAMVRRSRAPELGCLAELSIATELSDGYEIDTVNVPFATSFLPPRMRIDGRAGLSVAELVVLHSGRIASSGASAGAPADGGTGGAQPLRGRLSLASATRKLADHQADVRALFRQRGFVVPTGNPALDRFTLRGAISLTHFSRRVLGRGWVTAPAQPDATEQALRVEADLCAVLQIAEHPEPPPGTPWPLITVIAATALLSFVAMAALWNAYVAALILAVVAFHEAGHAIAMRAFGYRDVHVFFVPLLGAVTVGRPVATAVRDRLAVLLAGPVPGLWLAVVLLAVDSVYGPSMPLRTSALALLILNGMNLLPFTPLDGGRVLEALSRPESLWRLLIHAASVIGLIGLAIATHDPVIWGLAAFWAALLPRHALGHRLRCSVAAAVRDRADSRAVMRAALGAMAAPRYRSWRAPLRQSTARAIARQFAESWVTSADRRWGVIAYVWGWIPVAAAVLLWAS